jgi:hypothetical protein
VKILLNLVSEVRVRIWKGSPLFTDPPDPDPDSRTQPRSTVSGVNSVQFTSNLPSCVSSCSTRNMSACVLSKSSVHTPHTMRFLVKVHHVYSIVSSWNQIILCVPIKVKASMPLCMNDNFFSNLSWIFMVSHLMYKVKNLSPNFKTFKNPRHGFNRIDSL